MSRSQKGLIALDIDGTITSYPNEIPLATIQWFESLHQNGWDFIFLTGRPFAWSARTLKPLSFQYYLAVQNGALLLAMPSQRIVIRYNLNKKVLSSIDLICQKFHTHYVIYAGFENEDRCYYCPKLIPPNILDYALNRADSLGEKWISLHSFSELPIDSFSSIKFFTEKALSYPLSQAIEQQAHLHAPINIDPYNQNFFVIQATDSQATKGGILKAFSQGLNYIPIIAAGDDENDHTMFDEAHIKIAMANSPKSLITKSDIIAPPASKQGIIQGLEEAIQLLKKRGRVV